MDSKSTSESSNGRAGRYPTTTCTPARVRLYQPTRRPERRDGDWQENSWGRCKVNGRLGQQHADVMDAINYTALRAVETADGAIHLLVDPAKVRRRLGTGGYSGQRLWQLLREIRNAEIEIKTPKFEAVGSLISEFVKASETRPARLTKNRDGEGVPALRHLWRIRIGPLGVALLAQDLRLHYDPAPIARLSHGISQAVARHMLTHSLDRKPRGGSWTLAGLIRAVGGGGTPQDMRNARRRVKADKEGLRGCGVVVVNGRVWPEGVPQRPDIVPQRPGVAALISSCQQS